MMRALASIGLTLGLVASLATSAQEPFAYGYDLLEDAPTAEDEAERIENLQNAQSLEQAVDYMTPEELANGLGFDPNAGLIHPTNAMQVAIHVDLTNQTITVSSPEDSFTAPISSGRRGYLTDAVKGCHTPHHVTKMHYSRKYDNAPMPHSVFFRGGYAIHGTYEENKLGRPASHGCVRVARSTAKVIHDIVKKYGKNKTMVCVDGTSPLTKSEGRVAGQTQKPKKKKKRPQQYYQPSPFWIW